ncbi:DUF1700 domain-containing protein [Paenibacillus woosongensis]|uniref:DUF1700 domain-containing protein n=2 Tax=Paenibacillus woosongensis TaxID=307580 RepID=A0AA95I3K0_9BACL|nr:DUF1700 domain-containing protein [Paenibacillus woosongensis]WHX48831.1 DUF1700 domain-containing protein [Paenibacillus woosongensis]
MTKSEFISLLSTHLSALPPEERHELMEDYEAHFAFGLQNGKTEEEIVRELGDPVELAQEALGNRSAPQHPLYWFGEPPQGQTDAIPTGDRGTRYRKAAPAVYAGLFFLNLVMMPLLASLWAAALALALGAVGGIVSPAALLLEYAFNGALLPAKAFAALTLVGIGIFLAISTRHAYSGILKLSASYWAWNVRVAKGVKINE